MSEYYDIIVRACGFMNHVRSVEVEAGEPLLTCTLAALRGVKGERATPTYFQVKVVGQEARQVLLRFRDVINDRSRQVFASVKLSDLYVQPFIYQQGERQGESGQALKTRLLVIDSLAIDGQVVYRRAESATNGSHVPLPTEADAVSEFGQLLTDTPTTVRLSKDDPQFAAKRDALKRAGYRWNQTQRYWEWLGNVEA